MSASESTHDTAMPLGSKDSNEEPQLNAHKRPKKPAEVRRRILEVAQELASTAGAEGVRFSEVAKRADVTTGGIVHHFPNKNALLAAVIEVLVEEMEHDVEDAIGRGEPAPYLVTRVSQTHPRGNQCTFRRADAARSLVERARALVECRVGSDARARPPHGPLHEGLSRTLCRGRPLACRLRCAPRGRANARERDRHARCRSHVFCVRGSLRPPGGKPVDHGMPRT